MLTAKGEEIARSSGLEIGADDYITKPFSVKELSPRVKAVLRRSETGEAADQEEVFEFRGLRIDFKSYEGDGGRQDDQPEPDGIQAAQVPVRQPRPGLQREQILDRVLGR